MIRQGVSQGTPVVHQCELSHLMFDAPVTHVVLPPSRVYSTPLSDIRAAGFDVLATGLFPGEIGGCDDAGAYGNCQHLLVRSSKENTL
jgi:hypothetical protein